METVEVVIKIDKNTFDAVNELSKFVDGNHIINGYQMKGSSTVGSMITALAKGTVLPKGHGRLIDADAVLEEPFGNTYRDIDIAETIIEADKEVDKEKPNMMQQTMDFLKKLYLQNKEEIDKTTKEFYAQTKDFNEDIAENVASIEVLQEIRQQVWDITSKHLDSQRYALIRKADVLDIINRHLSDMQRNVPTVIEPDREGEDG